MDVPHADRREAVVLACELAGVENFLGQDALTPLHLATVARGVRLGLLMPALLADDPGKVAGSIAGAVVGDDPVDVVEP